MNGRGKLMSDNHHKFAGKFMARGIFFSLVSLVFLTTCDLFSPGLGAKVDIVAPKLSVSSPVSGSYVGGDIAFAGNASDDKLLKSVRIEVTTTSGLSTFPANVNTTTGAWTATVASKTLSTTVIADGQKTFKVIAADASGKETDVNVVLNVDNTPPTVIIDVPQGYGTLKPSTADFLEIKGDVYDKSPVTVVKTFIVDASTGTDLAVYTASGTNTFSSRMVFSQLVNAANNPVTLTDLQTYRYRVEALDTVGNKNTFYYHAQDIWALLGPSNLFPASDEIGKADQENVNLPTGQTAAAVKAVRIDNTVSHPYADFLLDKKTRNPRINLTSLDPQKPVNKNILGLNPAITGFALTGVADGAPAVDPATIKIKVWNNSVDLVAAPGTAPLGTYTATTTTLAFGYGFQMDLATGGIYLPDGNYQGIIEASTTQGDKSTVYLRFVVNSVAPTYTNLSPAKNRNLPVTGQTSASFSFTLVDNPGPAAADVVPVITVKRGQKDVVTGLLAASPTPIDCGATFTRSGDLITVTFTFPLALPADTWFQADLILTDNGGTIGNKYYDTIMYGSGGGKPTATVTNPPNNGWISDVTGNTIIFTGTGVSTSPLVSVNGKLVAAGAPAPTLYSDYTAASGTNTWSWSLDMNTAFSNSETDYDFYYVAHNTDDIWSSTPGGAKITVKYDKSAPTFTLNIGTAPRNDATPFAVTGSADDTRGLSSVYVTWNRINDGASGTILSVPSLAAGTKTQPINFTFPTATGLGSVDGIFNLIFTTTDVAGKVTSRSTQVTYDATPPSVSVSAPIAGSWVSASPLNVMATVSDGTGSGVASVWFKIANQGVDLSAEDYTTWTAATNNITWQASMALGAEGNKTLWVVAVDNSGHVTSRTANKINFGYDQTSPTLTEATGPVNYARGNYTYSGTASDSNGLASLTVSVNGGGATPITVTAGNWSYPVAVNTGTHANDGSYSYVFTATDLAGQVKQVTRSVTVDTYLPNVAINSYYPIVGTNNVNGQLNLIASASDSGGLAGAKLWVLPSATATPTWATAGDLTWATPYTAVINTTTLTDNADYKIWVRAQDNAGNENVVSATIHINQASDIPTITYGNGLVPTATTAGQATLNLMEYNASVGGTLADDDGINATTVQISVDGGAYTAVSTPPGTNGTNVSFSHDLSALAEGTHRFSIKATDTGGLTLTSPASGSIYFVIDKSAPTITITNPANGAGANADFNLTGTFTDTSGVKNLGGTTAPDVEWGTDGVTYTRVDGTGTVPTNSSTFNIPMSVATLGNGNKTLYIRATDIYGKTSVSQVRVLIDTAAPTVTYLYPNSGTSLNGLATIRGTSSDANAVNDVQYSLNGGSTWTSVTSDKYNWNFSFDTRSLTQGAFTLKVRAADTAGNISAVANLSLTLNQASDNPVITISNMDQTKTLIGQAGSNLQETNAQIQGSVSDDDWVDSTTVAYSIDGGAWTAPASVGSNSTIVNFSQNLNTLNDGVHYIAVRASDTDDGANARKGGLPAVQTSITPFYFSIDKTNPVVTITTPAVPYTTGSFTMSGTVQDGNNTNSLLVSTDGGATYSATGVSGFTAGSGSRSWSWTGDLSAKPEGPFTLKVKGIDQFNKESVADLTITIDKTGPAMSIGAPVASATVNGPVTLSGTGVETYGFTKVQIALDSNGNGVFTDPNDTNWTDATGTFAWTYNLDTTTKPDGTYTLYVRGLDAAGNYSAANATRTFTINQASDKPSLSLSTVSAGGTYAQNLLPGSLQISGTASDDDAVDHLSIQIKIDANNNGVQDAGENWISASGQPAIDSNVATWSHTFTMPAQIPSDGQYRFWMRVADINFTAAHPTYASVNDWTTFSDPNKWFIVGPVQFAVDSALPTGTVTSPAQGAFLKNPGTGNIVISGTASDGSGISKVEIKINNGVAQLATGTTSWSYTYPITADGQVNYQIIITDNYGKIFTIDRYFTIDTTAPTLAFSQPTANSTVNGSLLIRGTTNETYSMDKVYMWIGAHLATPTGNPTTGDWTGWTLLAGTFNWTNRVNTTLSANGLYDIHVRALDSAGNLSSDTILQNITYDQSTNIPVLATVNLTAAPANNLFGTGGTISGTVTDDDSVDATTIQISTDNGTTWSNVTNQGTSGPTVSFSHNLTTAGLAQSGTAYQVKLRFSDIGDVANGVPVQTLTTPAYNVAYDTSAPTTSASVITTTNRYTAAPITITGGALAGALINNNFTLKAVAADASGIASVQFSLNGGSYAAATYVGGTSTWDKAYTLDMAGHSNDGTWTFTILATDNWGKTTTSTLNLVVDTTEPTVTFLQPSAGSNVNGTVTIQGTTFDGGSLASLTMTGGNTDNVTFTNSGTNSAWSSTFNASTYTSATYATETPPASNIWAFPLKVTVYDAAGNRTIATRSVNLDPNGDLPVVVPATVLPATGASVSGTILLQSTVTDDDAPAYVRIYADLNDDGVITANAYPKDLNGNSNTTDAYETESNYQQVSITNGVWTTLVNGNNEFSLANMTARGVPSPTGWMRFKIVPYDIYGTAGNPYWTRVYLDETSPQILSLNYNSGALVKGTVNLTGTIRDDALLSASYIQISYDGGTTFSPLSVTGPTASGGFQNYTFNLSINTSTINSNAFAGSSGILYVIIKVTDNTFKQTQVNLNFNVDNKYPSAIFNYDSSMPKSGSLFTLYGNAGDVNNRVIGSAGDTGLVSGISNIKVYFVKNGNFISPKNGSTLSTSGNTATVRGTDVDLNYDGLTTGPGESAGTNATIPVPPNTKAIDGTNLDWYINVDNRIELGAYDSVLGIGDQDGFQESLKAKTGFDEWFSYFNTTKLPDGPATLYYLVTDQAGNQVYGTANIQVTNNPPSISSFADNSNGIPWTGSPIMVKYSGTFNLAVNGVDTNSNPGLDNTAWKVTVAEKWATMTNGVPGGQDGAFTPFFYNTSGTGGAIRAFTSVPANGAASGTGVVAINTTSDGFVDGAWYKLVASITDIDGNTVTNSFWLKVNNSDSTNPVVTIDPTALTQASVSQWTSGQGPLQAAIAAASFNTSTDTITYSLPSWITNNTKVAFAGSTAPTGLTVGTVYYVINNTGTTFQLGTFPGAVTPVDFTAVTGTYRLVSGGRVEASTDSQYNNTTADADVSGSVRLFGTVSDDTDVQSLTINIDGAGAVSVPLSNRTGDAINGYTYNWSYLWDTSTITTFAKNNVTIVLTASDFRSPSPNTGTASTQADVMPYITSIIDSTGLSSDVLRGSNGKYSIRQDSGNSLTLRGYNFGNSPVAWISTAAATPTSGVSFTPTLVNTNQLTLTKNLTKSGFLTIVQNTVPSLNNLNLDNDGLHDYNMERTSDPRTYQWTDTRFLWLWSDTQVSVTSLTGTALTALTYYNSEMLMNADQPEFSFNDENMGNTIYTTSDSAGTRRTGFRLTRPAAFAQANVSAVRQRFIATSYDTTWNSTGDNTGFLEVTGFGDQTTDGLNTTYSPSVLSAGTIKWMAIQGIDYYSDSYTTTGTYRSVNRFPFPKLYAETGNPNTGANIFLTYFDNSVYFKSLQFVSFRMTGAKAGNLTATTAGYDRSPNVITIPGTSNGRSSKYFDQAKIGSTGMAVAYYDPSTLSLKLASSAAAFASTGVAGTDGLTDTTNNVREITNVNITNAANANYVGKYFTIYNGTTAFDVWFDNTAGQTATKPAGATATYNIRVNVNGLAATTTICNAVINTVRTYTIPGTNWVPFRHTVAGNTTASQQIIADEYVNSTDANQGNMAAATAVGTITVNTQGASNWSTITLDSSADVGQHVSMVSDGTKIYVAYYDFDNADLKVARVSWNAGSPTLDGIVNVDNYLSAGTWTKIMLLKNDNLTGLGAATTAQPFIAYYSDSYNGTKKPIRLAFPTFDATTGSLQHGTTSSGADETYSGKWEVVAVPTLTVPQGGSDQFNRVKIDKYSSSTLPVLGWQGSTLEYAKLLPNY